MLNTCAFDTSVAQTVISDNVASLKMLVEDPTYQFIESSDSFCQLTETRLDVVIAELEEILLVLVAQSKME